MIKSKNVVHIKILFFCSLIKIQLVLHTTLDYRPGSRMCFFFFFFMGQSGGAIRWRVCYQRGLPYLVCKFGHYCKSFNWNVFIGLPSLICNNFFFFIYFASATLHSLASFVFVSVMVSLQFFLLAQWNPINFGFLILFCFVFIEVTMPFRTFGVFLFSMLYNRDMFGQGPALRQQRCWISSLEILITCVSYQ